jgi:hypothetical protein
MIKQMVDDMSPLLKWILGVFGAITIAAVAFTGGRLWDHEQRLHDIEHDNYVLIQRADKASQDADTSLTVAKQHGDELNSVRDEIKSLNAELKVLSNLIVESTRSYITTKQWTEQRKMIDLEFQNLKQKLDAIIQKIDDMP